jgi:hypothetical protein
MKLVNWLQRNNAEGISADQVNGRLSRRDAALRLGLLGIGAPAATGLIVACGQKRPTAVAAANTSALAGPSGPPSVKTAGCTAAVGEIVCCDASDGGFTVTLPEAPDDGARIVVKKIDNTSNAVLVQRSGSGVFNQPDGPSSLQLAVPSQTVILRYQSGVWFAESNSCPSTSLDGKYTPLNVRELMDANGGTALAVTPIAGAVNYLQLDPSATDGPKLSAAGKGTDLDLFLGAKNQGSVRILTDSGGTATIGTSSGTGPAQLNQNLNLRSQGDGVVQANFIEVATTTSTQTIRNKQIVPRVVSENTAASLTPWLATGDIYEITQLDQRLTVTASPDATTFGGQELLFRIRDNNTSQTVTWNKTYRPIGVTLPAVTVAGKWVYVRCIYNASDTMWDVIDVRQEA